MTRVQWILIAVIVAELGVGGVLAVWRLGRTTAPVPDLTEVDPITADEIREAAAVCRTPEQWAGLGETYLATGFFPESEACYREALRLDPVSADHAFKHGFVLERLGKLEEEANGRYEEAVQRYHPRKADCWYYIGKNHLRREQVAPARTAFEKAGPIPGARYELALLHARAGRAAEAEAEAHRLTDEFPAAYPPVSLRYRLAVARNDRAAGLLADQFAHRPRPLPTPFDTEVDWVFGKANGIGRNRLFRDAGRQLQAGQAESAETDLRSALAAGWNPEIVEKLAEVLLLLGRPNQAADLLAEAVTRGGPSFNLLWRLGQAYDATGRPDEALNAWQRAARIATGPRAQGLWHDLATRYDRAGKPELARPLQAQEFLAAGINQLNAGKPAEAVPLLRRAVEFAPELAHAWYYLGEAYRLSGRPEDARSAYERCLQIDPDHGRARRAREILTACKLGLPAYIEEKCAPCGNARVSEEHAS